VITAADHSQIVSCGAHALIVVLMRAAMSVIKDVGGILSQV
jgi:hypothetical protein